MNLIESIHHLANHARALSMARFYKTGPGEYAEHSVFLGLTSPQMQQLAKNHQDTSLDELENCLQNRYHEVRMTALFVLVRRYARGHDQEAIFDLYMRNLSYINNWDLVDISCRDIVGAHLFTRDRRILDDLAETPHLWSQRVAIVSTWYFIKKGDYTDTLRIAQKLLHHPHDLLHKAVGWMLREAWKRGGKQEVEDFLLRHIAETPRTLLRYAIERMPEEKRQYFLQHPEGKIRSSRQTKH
jgi:3-methyladenine DNA glycosylase AlkD